jgi:hypothetical protein
MSDNKSRTESWPNTALTAVWNLVALKTYHTAPTIAHISKTNRCDGTHMFYAMRVLRFYTTCCPFLEDTIIAQLVAITDVTA